MTKEDAMKAELLVAKIHDLDPSEIEEYFETPEIERQVRIASQAILQARIEELRLIPIAYTIDTQNPKFIHERIAELKKELESHGTE